MKKIWLMLLMISSICAFTACSDDDDDNSNTGGNNGKNPITELYLSDEIQTGEPTTILGKGFTVDAQIYVENTSGERTKVENVVANEKGITFTLPSTLATGDYTLILKQDNGEWELGTFKALRMVEMTQVKKITVKMREGDIYFLDLPYDLAYDEYGRLKTFSTTTEEEDGTSLTQAYEFTYTDNRIEVGGSMIDNETIFSITYTLENGKIINSKTKNYEFNWETQEENVVDAEYTWSYEGDYLKSMTGSSVIDFNYVDGNLMSIGEDYQFTFGKEVNDANVDVLSCILYFNSNLTSDQFLAMLLGACGKTSANLPVSALGTCSYTRDKDGLVSAVDVEMDMGTAVYVMTVAFEYEKVKVIAD